MKMKPLTKEYLSKKCHCGFTMEEVDQILNNQEMIQRLMESGYVLSKFGKDKTYSQTEMMYVFQGIIEGDK